MNFITPPPLKPGDTIGVMAPSSYVEQSDLAEGIAILQDHGFRVEVHPQTWARCHQSAGTPEQKRDALHSLAANTAIKAVIFAGGGNHALSLLDHLDYDLIARNPKIYMGFSDGTVLLNAIHARTGLVTYHGPVIKRIGKNPDLDFNLRLLMGQEKTILLPNVHIVKEGNAEGRLIGGNFSAFRRLVGSKEMPNTKGAILFLEDIGEELSRIDADFWFLRRAGILNGLAALVVGQFSDLKDTGRPYGLTFEDMIHEHAKSFNMPILMNAPFGHAKELPVFPIGTKVRLQNSTLQILD